MNTKLSVNLNKVALLRNQRDLSYPSVTGIARRVIDAGADGITVHPRPDERHIRPADVRAHAAGDYGRVLEAYAATARAAVKAGLGVNAGHDLTRTNLPAFRRRMPALAEVSIGHAITADALEIGFADAVHAYRAALA